MAFADLHTHTKNSDGVLTPEELIEQALKTGIKALAITDHNKVLENIEELQSKYQNIRLVNGSEITALHRFHTGKTLEIHIVGLLMKDMDIINEFLANNRSDGRERMPLIIQKLKSSCNIDIGTYELIQEYYPGKRVGRMQLAETMVRMGYVENVKDAFDIYIGDHGQKLAWVENPVKFATIEQVVKAIKKAKGISILAHALSYHLEAAELKELLDVFKDAGGHGMEVLYGNWDEHTRSKANELATQYGLIVSCASDYHGCFEGERLDHGFDERWFRDIETFHWNIYEKE